jgi:hypothetical protein
MQKKQHYPQTVSLTMAMIIFMLLCAWLFLSDQIATKLQAQQTTATQSSQTTTAEETANEDEAVDEISEELRQRIQRVREESTQVRGVNSISLSEKTARIGEVTRVTDESVTMQYQDGTLIVPLDDQAVLVRDDEIIAASDIEVGSWVMILGAMTRATFEPDFVVSLDESPLGASSTVVFGSLSEVTARELTISVRGSDEMRTVTTTTRTRYLDFDNDEVPRSALDEDISVVVVATANEDNQLVARSIKVLTDL